MVNLHIILDIDQTLIDSMDRNNYIKMSDDYERSLAFNTACDLIFKGK